MVLCDAWPERELEAGTIAYCKQVAESRRLRVDASGVGCTQKSREHIRGFSAELGCGGAQPALFAAVERGGVIRQQAASPALY